MRTAFIFLVTFVLIHSHTFGQTNIVPNSGFETASPCPNYPGQINYATGWNNVNLIYNNFTVGSPDYFHACGSASLGYNAVPPSTFDGFCAPRAGNAMVSTVLYDVPYPNSREYFSTQLTTPMTPGNTYTVSFWITNGLIPKSPFRIKNIGAHLSASPLSQTGLNVINVVPTCEITGYSGSIAWVNYTFTVNPITNLQYITLGSFRNDASNVPVSSYTGTTGPASSYAMYFWDDVEVWAPVTQGINELTSKYQDLNIYPNPSNDLVFISSSNPVDEISIFNFLGEKVLSTKIDPEDKKINIKELPNGIYFLQFYFKNQLVATKKLVRQ